jgi:hypothetical protein
MFMSPVQPGQDEPNPVNPEAPVPAPAMTEVEWYRNMLTSGLLAYTRQHASGDAHVPQAPGYTAPPPTMISVLNSLIGAGPGSSQYPSLESALQRKVQELVGIASIGLTNTQVVALLTMAATDSAAILGGLDPAAANIPALISKYVAIYSNAVTPV